MYNMYRFSKGVGIIKLNWCEASARNL